MCRKLLLLLLWSLKLALWAGTFPSGISLPEELVHLPEGGSLELCLAATPHPTLVWDQAVSISNSPETKKTSASTLSLDNCWVKP